MGAEAVAVRPAAGLAPAAPVGTAAETGAGAGAVDVALSWLVARAGVLIALGLASMLALPHRRGLLGWDAAHYLAIGRHGYPAGQPAEARFFPLLPLLVHAVAAFPGVSAAATLLVLANVAAAAYAVLLHRLARAEGMDAACAGRAVWLLALAPPAFVLVMGYAESLYGVLSVGFFLALRRQRWWVAAACGVLAGTCRPVAVVLVLAAAVEVSRDGWRARPRVLASRVAAVVGPAVGTAAYLLYVGASTGDSLRPFRTQATGTLRGAVVADPLPVALRLVRGALAGDTIGSGLHVAWLLVFLLLLIPLARALPASYVVVAAATLLLASTSEGMESLERYCWGAFPFVLAAASVTRRRGVFVAVAAGSAMLLVAYALLAFAGRYVP